MKRKRKVKKFRKTNKFFLLKRKEIIPPLATKRVKKMLNWIDRMAFPSQKTPFPQQKNGVPKKNE